MTEAKDKARGRVRWRASAAKAIENVFIVLLLIALAALGLFSYS